MDDADKTKAGSPPSGGQDDARSRVGTILAGRYRILRLLGEGAQGSVYAGEHLRIGRKDAIKVLQPSLLKDEDAVARFRRGASKASHINHPNVCTVYDFGETEDGLPFMASEFVEGKELHDVLRTDAPMDLERAVDLLEQTAAGLTAAHDLNIVHRDLKPANVMLTRGRRGREVVKVVDFDIAKGIGESEAGGGLTQAGWIIGTPQYMSPEQITASEIDARSDIYSLALIFFEMLTGKLPNEVGSTQKLMWQRVSGDMKRLDEALPGRRFPPGLQAVLDRALAKDPDDRPDSAIEFAREVRRAMEAAPRPSQDDLATAVAPAPELDATQVAEKPSVPSTRLAPDGGPPPVPPTRATPDQPPGAVPATRVAGESAGGGAAAGGDGTRPAWASTPVLAGVGGVVVVAALGGAWASGLIGGGGAPPVLANVPASPITLEEGGPALPLREVRLEDSEGQPVAGASLSFLSRDPSVVTTEGSQLTPASPGETWVLLSAGEVTDSVRVVVDPAPERIAQGGGEQTRGDSTSSLGGDEERGTGDTSGDRGGTSGGGDRATQDTASGDEGRSRRLETPTVTVDRINGVFNSILVSDSVQEFSADEQRAFRRDAETAWGQLELPPATRARAAWILAQFFVEGSDDYCQWATRAVQLEPNNQGYRVLATPCRQ